MQKSGGYEFSHMENRLIGTTNKLTAEIFQTLLDSSQGYLNWFEGATSIKID